MDISYYIFSLFIFALLCAFMFILKKYIITEPQKASKMQYQKEEKLFKLYQNIEDMMDGFEEYVKEVKEEINAEKAGIIEKQDQVMQLYNSMTQKEISTQKDTSVNKKKVPIIKEEDEHQDKIIDDSAKTTFPTKNEKVLKLFYEGMSLDNIARELNISKGEIQLIIGLVSKSKL